MSSAVTCSFFFNVKDKGCQCYRSCELMRVGCTFMLFLSVRRRWVLMGKKYRQEICRYPISREGRRIQNERIKLLCVITYIRLPVNVRGNDLH